MMRSHPFRFKTAATALMLGVIGLAWIQLAPLPIGGQAAYVIVNGNSMEPQFQRGDLVILHQAADYQIGDIATYRHPAAGPIIHRIKARQGDRFVLQGDNNDWVDSYQPHSAEIIGKLRWHLPAAGKIVERLRTPALMALLAAWGGLVALFPIQGGTQDRRGGNRPHRHRPRKRKNSMEHHSDNKTDLVIILAILALASFLLAGFAFTRPTTRTLQDEITYRQTGTFSYSAAAPTGIYAGDRVQPGEPIFRRLIDEVTVSFDYQFVADRPANLRGTYRLLAQLSHPNGWKQAIELQPETGFSGSRFNVSGVINLAEVQALIDSLEQQTGLQSQQYTLSIVPEVFVQGIFAGQELQAEFLPRLKFRFDKLQMQLAEDRSAASDTKNPFKPSQQGLLMQPREAANTLSLLGFQLKVWTARLVALSGLILSLGGILVVSLLMFEARQGSELSRLQAKYGPLLITVRSVDPGSDSRMIEVGSIEDLAKIADRNGCMILHQTQGTIHHYFVRDGEVSYRYRLANRNTRHRASVMKVRPL